jgi:uncharacterized protein (TIGR02147 family)
MSLFEFKDYKKYVTQRVHGMPKRGRGQWLKIAKSLDMHTTMVSQVFRGNFHLTPEQAQKLSAYFDFSDLETEYFMNLVLKARAGTRELRDYYSKKLRELKEKALKLSERLSYEKELTESDRALFYSSWLYSAASLLTSIPKFQSYDAITNYFDLPNQKISEVIDFLLRTGLCEREGDRIKMGVTSTHVGEESMLVARHHANWRQRNIQKVDTLKREELMFTCPVTLSHKDFAKVREDIVQFIESFRKRIDPSPSEEMACLNIDWVRVER